MENAKIIIQGLLQLNMMASKEPKTDDDMTLVQDPRRLWNQIERILVDDVHAETLLIESIREILNVAYAYHELTSEHIDKVVHFWLNNDDQ